MTTLGPDTFYGGGAPLTVVLAALLADAALAGLPGLRQALATPEALLGSMVSWLDRRLNRDRRSTASRTVRGMVVVTLATALAFGAGYLIAWLALGLRHGWVVDVVVVASLLAQRSAFDAARSETCGLRG